MYIILHCAIFVRFSVSIFWNHVYVRDNGKSRGCPGPGTQCVILNQKVQSLEGSISWPCASSCFSLEQGLAQGRGQVDPPIIY